MRKGSKARFPEFLGVYSSRDRFHLSLYRRLDHIQEQWKHNSISLWEYRVVVQYIEWIRHVYYSYGHRDDDRWYDRFVEWMYLRPLEQWTPTWWKEEPAKTSSWSLSFFMKGMESQRLEGLYQSLSQLYGDASADWIHPLWVPYYSQWVSEWKTRYPEESLSEYIFHKLPLTVPRSYHSFLHDLYTPLPVSCISYSTFIQALFWTLLIVCLCGFASVIYFQRSFTQNY